MTGVKESLVSIVLVHGGFVDGSGWRGGYETLRQDGAHGLRLGRPHARLHAEQQPAVDPNLLHVVHLDTALGQRAE